MQQVMEPREVIVARKVLTQRDVSIQGRSLHLELAESEALCPIPRYTAISLAITGDVTPLFLSSTKGAYDLVVTEDQIQFGGMSIRFGNEPDRVQINEQWFWIGMPGTVLALEFADGEVVGLIR